MKYYKELLLKKLCDSGWELLEKDDETDWWLESYWKIKSIKNNYGKVIYILFLVDPMYDGNIKSSAVWAVGAFEKLPSSRPLIDGISLMDMVKGKFDQKLTKFVIEINGYRDEVHS